MSKAIGTITWKPTPKHKKTTQASFKASHKRSSTNTTQGSCIVGKDDD